MKKQDVFVSVIVPVKDRKVAIEPGLRALHDVLGRAFRDFEILVVDNGSTDGTGDVVQALQGALDNINLFRLARSYPEDTRWVVGLDNCIGDYVVMLDLDTDPVEIVVPAVEKAILGHEVVYGVPADKDATQGQRFQPLFYRCFNYSSGLALPTQIQRFRVLSRRVVNFVTRNKDKCRLYKVLPAIGGFSSTTLPYAAKTPAVSTEENLGRLWAAFYILVSTSQKPLRLITSAALAASGLSSLYVLYVLIQFLTRTNLAPGWVSLSLVGGCLSFLLFLCLSILSEYLYQIIQMNRDLPPYFITDETSSRALPEELETNVLTERPTAKAAELVARAAERPAEPGARPTAKAAEPGARPAAKAAELEQ